MTVQDLIEQAFYIVGITPDGGTPTADQLDFGLNRFNAMMQSLGADANATWLRRTAPIALEAGVEDYDTTATTTQATTRPIRILSAYRSDGTYDTTLTKMSKAEYFQLSDKASAGLPTQFWYDQASPTGTVYIWPVPEAADLPLTLYIDYISQFEDAVLADDLEFPAIWVEAATYNLAMRLAQKYGKVITNDFLLIANDALSRAKGQDTEDAAIYLKPSMRGER